MDYYTNIVRRGDRLLIRGVRNGEEVRDKVRYEPTLYIEHHKDYGYKSLYGKSLKPIEFSNMNEAWEFSAEHKDSNLKVYGFPRFESQYSLENFGDAVTKWDKKDLRIFNIDIEVFSNEGFPEAKDAAYPVTAICIHDSKVDKFVTFGHGKWNEKESILPEDIRSRVMYVECKTETDLLTKFLQYWNKFTPNIVTGWNIEKFDFPYLYNRLENMGIGGHKLSPWGRASLRNISTSRGEEIAVTIDGVDQIDYIERYRKTKIQESYRLDFIASVELGERKLDYSEVSGLHMLYVENFQKFIDYNIQDVNLVKRLDEKLGLIDAQIMIAYMACINYGEVNSTVRTWDSLINKELQKDRVIPHFHITTAESSGNIPGGHVKEPQVGKHGWCMSFDLNSLYPHLIMQFNISPETFRPEEQVWPMEGDMERVQKFLSKEKYKAPKGLSVSGSGYTFSNEIEGVIPRLMRRLYDDRKKIKQAMLQKQREGKDDSLENLRQYVIKILLNSGYGAFVNKYFRWYDQRIGKSITLSGQLVIQIAEREINKWMNKVLQTENVDYIIAIDTDSNYLNCQPLVDKFFSNKSKNEIVDILDKIAKEQVQKVLEEGWVDTKDYLNAYDQKMVMEREAIASSAFWTAKKRYAMCVWDMEGVRMPDDKPKLKIQGLDAIRSSTPQSCREALLTMIRLTLLEDEKTLQSYISDFKDKFKAMQFEDIAFPRTMNNISKMTQTSGFAKGTPPHIRGAIQFNRLLKQYKLEKDWETMKDGEKGKFIYLREPNNIGTNVLSFNHTVPKEFDFIKYIDFEKQFSKAIIEPMDIILSPIGWTPEKQNTLEDFFS
ncbi:MAG: DNA polymerase [Porticoccaceae bacterium]|jgi:DNA polymerase elongation subunit (family B)|nr:DNA polymerase [Porticoccaceae bacterium]|tara:strand:- start:6644 stop:9136 length:2493 start_codon:yes stop_codon:yes gene_type:complete